MPGDRSTGADDERDDWPRQPTDVPVDWVHRRRAFRGISVRLAVHYLGNLGGEVVGENDGTDAPETADHERSTETEALEAARTLVVGDGWRATLAPVEVGIGPTLSLTEVRVAFAGDPDGLDELIDRFAQKAMRAGG